MRYRMECVHINTWSSMLSAELMMSRLANFITTIYDGPYFGHIAILNGASAVNEKEKLGSRPKYDFAC